MSSVKVRLMASDEWFVFRADKDIFFWSLNIIYSMNHTSLHYLELNDYQNAIPWWSLSLCVWKNKLTGFRRLTRLSSEFQVYKCNADIQCEWAGWKINSCLNGSDDENSLLWTIKFTSDKHVYLIDSWEQTAYSSGFGGRLQLWNGNRCILRLTELTRTFDSNGMVDQCRSPLSIKS